MTNTSTSRTKPAIERAGRETGPGAQAGSGGGGMIGGDGATDGEGD